MSKRSLYWRYTCLLLSFLLLGSLPKTASADDNDESIISMVCNDLGQVALDQNCEATISPDDVLEGTYPDLSIFTVEITDASGNSYGNMLTAANIGQTLTATVTNTTNGNTCDGMLTVADNLVPALTCAIGPITIPCSQSAQPTAGGTPGFPFDPALPFPMLTPDPTDPDYDPSYSGPWTVDGFDPCGLATLTFSDLSSTDPCGAFNKIIYRNWTIVDESGNSNSCADTIQLERPTVTTIACPPNWTGIGADSSALSCTARKDLANAIQCGTAPQGWNVLPDDHIYAGHPSPYDELYPGCSEVKWFGTGVPGADICSGVQSSFEDRRINICPTGDSEGCYKIIRDWIILDWCSGLVFECQQIIKVEDNEGPSIADIDDLEISVGIWGCTATWNATIPWLDDDCSSSNLSYTVSSASGVVSSTNGNWRISGLEPGIYDVTYSAFDCCGNQTDSIIQLTVADNVPPVAVCDQHTVVSLTTNSNPDDSGLGYTKAFASTFDDGSFDNCSDQVWFKVIRMDEFDSNNNGINHETVIQGDWQSIDCDGVNGDDDLRRSPPFHPNYNLRQSYFDDFAKFCCADISQDSVLVVFRVFDIDPEPYTFGRQYPALVPAGENPDDYNGVLPEAMAPGGPLYGHYSDCMVEVVVQDKLPPLVVAPPNITVTCDFWFPFDADNPNSNTAELDEIFGKVVIGSTTDLDSIVIRDRVCAAHPRFREFAPLSIFDDPCYDDQYDIYWGKDGYALDNCGLTLRQTVIPNLHCGRGSILRRWQGTDDGGNAGNTASQRITIIDCKEFYVPTACWRLTAKDVGTCDLVNLGQGLEYRTKLIEWPCDVDLSSCQVGVVGDPFAPENLDIFFDQDRAPRFDDDNCSLMAATFDDTRYTFVDGACLKIFREWKVIDWCLYEDGVTPYEWSFTQVIKLLNSEAPTFDFCVDIVTCGFGNPTNPSAPQCGGFITLDPAVQDDCTATDQLKIDYKIDEGNDGDYDRLGFSSNYGNTYPFPNPGNLPVAVFDAADPEVSGFFEVGTHRILWNAEDGCGNTNSCSYLFTVEDCKPPTAYCLPGVSTIPMPMAAGGFIDIWASDFNLDSYDNCTDTSALRYSFSQDINDRVIRRTCNDVTDTAEALVIYVWDEADNFATCNVELQLSNCNNQTQANVAGDIRNEEGARVNNVMVHLEGSMIDEQMTDEDGNYAFADLPTTQNYIVRPEKDINPLNGVSTYDLVLISRHILGVELLNSPYKMIAADVNRSGSLTTFDLVELRKLILFIDTEFESNTSWRFIDAAYNFPLSTNPFSTSFPEVYNINDLEENEQANFIAIKTGDVNCSATPGNFSGSDSRNASATLKFRLDNQQLKAGEPYQIDFRASDFNNILGYQFSLNYNREAIAIEGIASAELNQLTKANFGQLPGVLTTSWNSNQAHSLSDDAIVFTLHIQAKQTVKLSEVMQISSAYTAAEAYASNLDLMDVDLEYTSSNDVAADFALLQNIPNPFKNETMIAFYLPEAGQANLSIYDLSGRQLKTYQGNFAKGYNEISINRAELGGSGVLHYTLTSNKASASKKMILLD